METKRRHQRSGDVSTKGTAPQSLTLTVTLFPHSLPPQSKIFSACPVISPSVSYSSICLHSSVACSSIRPHSFHHFHHTPCLPVCRSLVNHNSPCNTGCLLISYPSLSFLHSSSFLPALCSCIHYWASRLQQTPGRIMYTNKEAVYRCCLVNNNEVVEKEAWSLKYLF